MIAIYEELKSKLGQEKRLLAEKADLCGQPVAAFEQMFELAMRFPANLCKVWESGRLDHQRFVLKLTFSHRIAYDRNERFSAPQLSFEFWLLGVNQSADCNMADRDELCSNTLFKELEHWEKCLKSDQNVIHNLKSGSSNVDGDAGDQMTASNRSAPNLRGPRP